MEYNTQHPAASPECVEYPNEIFPQTAFPPKPVGYTPHNSKTLKTEHTGLGGASYHSHPPLKAVEYTPHNLKDICI